MHKICINATVHRQHILHGDTLYKINKNIKDLVQNCAHHSSFRQIDHGFFFFYRICIFYFIYLLSQKFQQCFPVQWYLIYILELNNAVYMLGVPTLVHRHRVVLFISILVLLEAKYFICIKNNIAPLKPDKFTTHYQKCIMHM